MPTLSATVHMPRVGAWTMDAVTQDETALSGSVELVPGMVGTVVNSGIEGKRCHSLIVGGDGTLGETLQARHYSGPSVRTVLVGLLGDRLDGTTSVSGRLTDWTRTHATRGESLTELTNHAGLIWRVLDTGLVWVGTESYPAVETVGQRLDADPGLGRYVYATEEPTLRPGVTHDGIQVDAVTHHIKPTGNRSIVFAKQSRGERAAEALRVLVRSQAQTSIDLSAMYPATVTVQDPTGRVTLRPDSERIRGLGIKAVPLRHGLPGITSVLVPIGTRVLLGFEDGDAAKPYAMGWESGSVTTLEFDGDNKAMARVDDAVHGGYLLLVSSTTGVASIEYFDSGAVGDAAAQVALAAAAAVAATAGTPPPKLLELSGGSITSGSSKLFA